MNWLPVVLRGLVLAVVPGVVLIIVGIRMHKGASDVGRVQVEGVVVQYTHFVRPPSVVFDYPLPDGTWRRACRVVGVAAVQGEGFFVRPGARIPVYVDPRRPEDVSLGPFGSVGGLGGLIMVFVGAVMIMFGLVIVLSAPSAFG